MANSRQVVTSLLTEHFRYTPLTLLDDIINLVNELVYRAVTAVEEGLTSAPAASLGFAERANAEGRPTSSSQQADDSTPTNDVLYPESRIEIEHGVHQLETLLESTVDKNFDKLEIFVLRSILSVPEELVEWLQLKHYENLDFSSASTPSTITPQSLYLLRRKLHETRKLNNALRAEQARNAALIAQLRSLLTPQPAAAPVSAEPEAPQPEAQASLAFLTSSGAPGAQSQDLSAQTAALLPHLPALRHLLTTLKARLPLASNPPSAIPSDPAAAAAAQHTEERRAYIEDQARKRLERQGVDVENGSGVGGTNDVAGKIGADEIKGIENVVGALGAGNAGGDAMEE